ncbi:MAG: pyridoxamine 5'-phosphate oxidase family protein [Chitinivibrionales bacterium]|nr:pyridoxamine 5'-phosphate oxidase family protein [Chitinivibrionales bacterium]MBD3396431.1 pyridoxamine 5'-phosphate oxidase family protein [Chitinivibrionales bacterium]
MSEIPQAVKDAWEARQGAAVFVTADEDRMPNAIYVSCIRRIDDSRFVVADNYFNKTRLNINAGSKGCILFITDQRKAFQVKGPIQYLTSGDVFDDMKTWLDPKHPGKGAAVLTVEEAYSGGEKLR